MVMKSLPAYFKITCYLILTFLTVIALQSWSGIFIPLIVGVLLAFLLLPVSRMFERWRVPRIPAIIISLLLTLILIGGVITFLSSQFLSFSEEIPMLSDRLNERFRLIQTFIHEHYNITEQRQIEWLEEQLAAFLSSSGKIFSGIFSATGSFIAAAALIPIYIFFITYYRHKFIQFIKMLTPQEQHGWVLEVIQLTSNVSQKYLLGLIIDIFILSVLNSVGFLLLGINHAILLGVVAAILNIIPYIGVLIGSIFPIAMALLTHDSIWVAVGALGVCVAVQFLDNNFITPLVVGSSVSINPFATIIALLIGGQVWGVAGMILFIPLLGMLKVVLDNVDALKPYGYLIGEEQKMKTKKKKLLKVPIHPEKENNEN